MRIKWFLIMILALPTANIAQNLPCYNYRHITIPANSDIVKAIFIKNNLQIKKKIEIIYTDKEILYFYKTILYRIEIKNYKSLCKIDEDGFYIEEDIIVYYDDSLKRTSITSWKIWQNLVRDK